MKTERTLRLIFGDAGSGKTTRLSELIAERTEQGKRSYLVVPEQETVLSERQMADMLPPSYPLCFEVTNFSRLADTVFRSCGGVCYRGVTPGVRAALMWRVLGELSPLLRNRALSPDIGTVRATVSAMRELRACAVTPVELERAARSLESGVLTDKLHDLSLIATLYGGMLSERYDDGETTLDRLASLLAEQPFFEGAAVCLDSFTSLTEQQYRVLGQILRQCDVTVTLAMPQTSDALCYEELRAYEARLRRIADDCRAQVVTERLEGSRRTGSPFLRYLGAHLWDSDPHSAEAAPTAGRECLSVVEAVNAYDAAEYVACDILRRVEGGARLRDFAIVARAPEQYRGILDSALERCGIPCFLSGAGDVDALEPIKLIYCAEAVVNGGYRQADVLAFLKCSLCGIDRDDADLYDLYAERWHIRGRERYTGDRDFAMNPGGYTGEPTERDRAVLEAVNRVRRRIGFLLGRLSAERLPVLSHARALMELLIEIGMEERLRALAASARAAGETRRADEYAGVYAVICDTLDSLCEALPDTSVSGEEFAALLRLFFGEAQIGRIPPSCDEVTIGSAELLRLRGIRHVYLFGVNAGEFPAAVSDSSSFSEAERRRLCELGVNLRPDFMLRASRELFCFSRALCAASERLTVVYAASDCSGKPLLPAPVIDRLRAFCHGELPLLRTAELSSEERISMLLTPALALRHLGEWSGTPYDTLLTGLLQGDPCTAERARRFDAARRDPTVQRDRRLSAESVGLLMGNELHLSQTRLESYLRCPFSFFCNHLLGLREEAQEDFDRADIGSFIHSSLERLFALLSERGERIDSVEREVLTELVNRAAEDCLRSITPPGQELPARLFHLLLRLRRTLQVIAGKLRDEFGRSAFYPRFHELSINGDDPCAPGAIGFSLADGSRLSVGGIIDRVDTYRAEDGRVYFRIIDYKTGTPRIVPEEIAQGSGSQLLLYLMTLQRSRNPLFLHSIGCAPGESPIPAGALYIGAAADGISEERPTDPATVVEEAKGRLYKAGLLLDDAEVLRKMDEELSGQFQPVRAGADGEVRAASGGSLMSPDDLNAAYAAVEALLLRTGNAMRAGDIRVAPRRDRGKDACSYCPYYPICRVGRRG